MSDLIKTLIKKNKSCNSVWFMRQAGRYLPEFRKIRQQNQNFIKLCLNSELSSQISLQPVERFDLDAAIIFSDILLVPHVLGQDVIFDKEHGPNLSKFNQQTFLNFEKDNFLSKLKPVYDAINKTRKKLKKDKSLISFIGGPWTLLVYMMNLKKNKNEIDRNKFKDNKQKMQKILSSLIEYLCLHIKNQISAGADIVQVFDSWAGLLENEYLNELCFEPNYQIVEFCKKENIPVICFPRGIKEKYAEFNLKVKPDGLNIDYEIDPTWARDNLTGVTLQGGMNPKILLRGQEEINAEAKKYLDIFKDVPYIFNLGHGLVPETDPEKLGNLVKFIRNY